MLEISTVERLQMNGELQGGITDWTQMYPLIFSKTSIPEGRVLDVGSNDARLKKWLDLVGVERDVVSFDLRPLNSVSKFVRGTARELPFLDNSFTCTTSFAALPLWCTEKVLEEDVLREMLRVTSHRVILWPLNDTTRGALYKVDPNVKLRVDFVKEPESRKFLEIATIDK